PIRTPEIDPNVGVQHWGQSWKDEIGEIPHVVHLMRLEEIGQLHLRSQEGQLVSVQRGQAALQSAELIRPEPLLLVSGACDLVLQVFERPALHIEGKDEQDDQTFSQSNKELDDWWSEE